LTTRHRSRVWQLVTLRFRSPTHTRSHDVVCKHHSLTHSLAQLSATAKTTRMIQRQKFLSFGPICMPGQTNLIW